LTHFGQTKCNMTQKEYTVNVSDSFDRTDEKNAYEVSFRRWLVQEIEEGKMTPSEAIKKFNFHPKNGLDRIRYWRTKYASDLVLSLPEMTATEKQQLAELQKQNKALQKALEDAKMKNIAINMLIDVAEEKLKINIRKKPGAKQ
jgi:transposase-like protein